MFYNGWLYMLCDHNCFKLYTALTRITYTTCYAQYGLLTKKYKYETNN